MSSRLPSADSRRFHVDHPPNNSSDLGWGVPPEDIFEKLKEIWDIPLRRKCRVLALTVPEAGLEGATRERIDVRRNKLNDLIKGYKRENLSVLPFLPYRPSLPRILKPPQPRL